MRATTQYLLALDTSTRTVGLALYDGAQVVYESAWTSPSRWRSSGTSVMPASIRSVTLFDLTDSPFNQIRPPASG